MSDRDEAAFLALWRAEQDPALLALHQHDAGTTVDRVACARCQAEHALLEAAQERQRVRLRAQVGDDLEAWVLHAMRTLNTWDEVTSGVVAAAVREMGHPIERHTTEWVDLVRAAICASPAIRYTHEHGWRLVEGDRG